MIMVSSCVARALQMVQLEPSGCLGPPPVLATMMQEATRPREVAKKRQVARRRTGQVRLGMQEGAGAGGRVEGLWGAKPRLTIVTTEFLDRTGALS